MNPLCGCSIPKTHVCCQTCGDGSSALVCGVCADRGLGTDIIPGTARETCLDHKDPSKEYTVADLLSALQRLVEKCPEAAKMPVMTEGPGEIYNWIGTFEVEPAWPVVLICGRVR